MEDRGLLLVNNIALLYKIWHMVVGTGPGHRKKNVYEKSTEKNWKGVIRGNPVSNCIVTKRINFIIL